MSRSSSLRPVFLVSSLVLAFFAPMAMAAGEPQSDADCVKLIEQWATDPKAVPKQVVDQCKAQLDEPAREPLVEEPADDRQRIAALDPCSGPDAASSVLCWGPWASLAPAAEGPPVLPQLVELRDPETRPELADAFDPDLEEPGPPPLPLDSCPPGTPCGFATVVDGVTSADDADDTVFARFDLAADGTSFEVDPADGSAEVDSVAMTTLVTPRSDGYENLRAAGRDGDVQSRLVARVVRDDQANVQLAGDVWTHGVAAPGSARSGYFAWGTATTTGGIDALKVAGTTLTFTGPMSVDNATVANLTLNFSANPTWNGTWTNPGYTFGAGGLVTGADFISKPEQFTPNVVGSGNYVQGALLGEAGARGIAHIINVNLENRGPVKDVGLLREAAAP